MSKVYKYSKKIFNYIGAAVLLIGVGACTTTQTTAALSGETDGVYYSPDRDGRVDYANTSAGNDYDIKVGGAYFDANGNGAEDFYYDDPQAQQSQPSNGNQQTVNIYNNGGSFSTSPSTDWGRYDGLDITINNYGYGWYSPWRFGYSSYWGWGYPYYGSYWGAWGYPYYGSYWGWGYPYHGSYWGWGYPYYGYGYGYGGYYGSYFHRGTAVAPGIRPGSGLSYGNGSPYRMSGTAIRDGRNIGETRTGNVRGGNTQSNVRAVRSTNTRTDVQTGAVRTGNVRATQNNNNNIGSVRDNTSTVRDQNTGAVRNQNTGAVRDQNTGAVRNQNTGGVRGQNTGAVRSNGISSGQNSNGSVAPVRQVRPTAPANVRPNSTTTFPTRSNNSNIRNNNNMSTPRTTSPNRSGGSINVPRSSSPSSGINRGTSVPRSSSPSIRSSPSSSSSMGGGVRSSGGSIRR
ncbi:MAG: hypothetical protein PHO74_04555 [Weeksellaceae bacterium]|nr:hypothetical protein [Weeksellaceae bacterium]